MATTMKLSDALVKAAKPYAAAMQRSVPKQIEYWARIGRAAKKPSARRIDSTSAAWPVKNVQPGWMPYCAR